MPSHFSSIGFSIESEQDLIQIAQKLMASAEIISFDFGRYRKWTDGNIEMWLHFNTKEEFVGLTPAFNARSTFKVAITEEIETDYPFDGTLHAWANPNDAVAESGDYPFVFDIPDRACYSELSLPKFVDLSLSAFAHELKVFANEEEYYRSQTEEPSFAVESFIPSGLFIEENKQDEQPTATAFFSGKVLSAEKKVNPITGLHYHWIKVKTLGCEIDIVADPVLCPTLPTPEMVLSGSFWLCGHLHES